MSLVRVTFIYVDTFRGDKLTKTIIHMVNGIRRTFLIRWSNNHDVLQIHEWLQKEDALEVQGNFLCNWSLTRQCHEEGTLLVLIDQMKGIPVAYQWGQLLRSGILQVRNGWRSAGLGRLVVEYCIELALQKNEMVLRVECNPRSSIPFWKAMGFTIVEGGLGESPKGFRVLSKQIALPPGGRQVSVMISSFPEERIWQENVPAIASYCPQAIITGNGKVYLAQRVAFSTSFRGDPVIEIIVDGNLIYRDKAKYQRAHNLGVKWCRNGFYIDMVAI